MDTKDLIQALAERLIWIAPVGSVHETVDPQSRVKTPVRGFMVCKRSVNNVDQGNTRVDYLMLSGDWKKPFTEERCMFATLDDALVAAANAAKLS